MRIKDWTPLYLFGYTLVTIGARTFYKNHQVVGIENIPKDKPVLFAANHQNAFLDPTLIGIKLNKPLYYMVRADIFKKKSVAKLLWSINMMPIYRQRDGGNTVKKNEAVFDKCFDLLNSNKPILIFAEGNQGKQKKLRPLQKGVFRIGLGAENKHEGIDVHIVPVGLYYSDTVNMGAKMLIHIGKSMKIQDYAEAFKTDEANTLNKMKIELSGRMSDLMVDIQSTEYYETIHEIMLDFDYEIYGFENIKGNKIINEFHCQKGFISKVENWIENNPEEAKSLKDKSDFHTDTLKKLQLKSWLFRKEKHNILFPMLFLILGAPLHLYGIINNYLPYKLPFIFVKKKVKDVHFHSSIKMLMGVVLFCLFWGLQTGLVAIFTEHYIWLYYFGSLIISSFFSYLYWITILKTKGKLKYNKLAKNRDARFLNLQAAHVAIEAVLVKMYT
ncbi:1-acyl-sn-glycerol-3-phosphate acyltransferase [Flavobacteriales bacterium]|nr:1-acyl-sn-glycerol-3-phosphate acyltransferase [Flavobacteriales bacterium]